MRNFSFLWLFLILIGGMVLMNCSDSEKLTTAPEPYIPPSDTQPEPLVVEGKVVDINNQPVADVTVDLVDEDGLLLLRVMTDLLGNYYFEADQVDASMMTAIARKEGYISTSSHIEIVGKMARTSIMTLYAKPAAVRQVITRGGGTIESTTEMFEKPINIRLDVPAGALNATKELSVTPLRHTETEMGLSIFDYLAATELGPSDVEFNQPVTVTFSLRALQFVGTTLLVRTYNHLSGEWEQAVDKNNHPIFATVIEDPEFADITWEDPQFEGLQVSKLAQFQLTRFAANGTLRQDGGGTQFVLGAPAGGSGGGSLTVDEVNKETNSITFTVLDPDGRSYTLTWQSDLLFADPNDLGDFTADQLRDILEAALGGNGGRAGNVPFDTPQGDTYSYAPGDAPDEAPAGAAEPGSWQYNPVGGNVESTVPSSFDYVELTVRGGRADVLIASSVRMGYLEQSLNFPNYLFYQDNGASQRGDNANDHTLRQTNFLPSAQFGQGICNNQGLARHTFDWNGGNGSSDLDWDLITNYNFTADQDGVEVLYNPFYVGAYCYSPSHDQ